MKKFDKLFTGVRLDKEEEKFHANNYYYQSGEANNLFRAFVKGYQVNQQLQT